MGFHICEYITQEQAQAMNLRNKDVLYSSGDVFMTFTSGHAWIMPDMARLYVELGWVPPQDFIQDVMTGTLMANTPGATRTQHIAIGYLNPKEHPLPLRISDQLPPGFLEKLEGRMKEASAMGSAFKTFSGRLQTKSAPPKPL